MKTFLLTLSLILCINSFSNTHLYKPADEISRQLISFLNQFDTVVATHDWHAVVGMMDENYKTEQLNNMLKGDTLQFIEEFFCGLTQEINDFLCAPPEKISHLTRAEIIVDGDIIQAQYMIVLEDGTVIETNWFIKYIKKGTKYTFGIIGAVG